MLQDFFQVRWHGTTSRRTSGRFEPLSLPWLLTKLGQEYVKIPFADFNALKLPPGTEHEADFALLSDIFPTVGQHLLPDRRHSYSLKMALSQGWHGVELSVRKALTASVAK